MSKRERDEDDVDVALQGLEAAIGRDTELKLVALRAVSSLVDPSDESYAVQRQAADGGALEMLAQLLGDESGAVRVEAARALGRLCQHSPAVLARMGVSSLSHTPDRLPLNPVQGDLAGSDLEDVVFCELTALRFSSDAASAAAGAAALSALTALNRDNTVAAVRETVHRLLQLEPRALEALEDLLATLDARDDVGVLLDQALSPALRLLREGAPADKLDALSLLASLCEKRPGAAGFLVAEGALPPVAAMLLSGDLAAADAAARALWLLVKDGKRKLLDPNREALGVPGSSLVAPLLALVEAGEDADDDGDGGGDSDDDESQAGGDHGGGDAGPSSSNQQQQQGQCDAAGAPAGAKMAVDNGDDALLLLRALAAHDPAVREKLAGQGGEVLGSRCAIM